MNNVEVVRAFYSNLATGNMSVALGLLDAKVEWNESEAFSYGGVYIGPDAVLANVFMKFAAEWEGFSVTVEQVIDGGEFVVATGLYAGTYKTTGKSMCAEFAHIWQLANAKVVHFRMYTDTLKINNVLTNA